MIPRAIDWFTGEALAYEELEDEGDEGELVDEDDEDDDEEEDHDEDDESEEEVSIET